MPKNNPVKLIKFVLTPVNPSPVPDSTLLTGQHVNITYTQSNLKISSITSVPDVVTKPVGNVVPAKFS